MWQSKSDKDLEQDVREELTCDPRLATKTISVSAKDGVVTLSGSVPTYAMKVAAHHDAERVNGVRIVVEHMDVSLPDTHARSDADLAKAVAERLRWDVEVPQNKIKATVRDGVVTLEGAVDWAYQRFAAEGALRYLAGVKGLRDLIVVSPSPGASSVDVKQHIKAALTRSAEADAARITVDTAGGSVTLRGTVHSWAERDEAVRAAWATPGVQKVQSELTYASAAW